MIIDYQHEKYDKNAVYGNKLAHAVVAALNPLEFRFGFSLARIK